MIPIEKNTDVKIKCFKCGTEHPMGMMRMNPNGKSLVCRPCLERGSSKKEPMQQAKNQEPTIKEYFCKDCKYSFKRAKHLAVSTCPYCGSGSLMIKGSTARIIADASKMKDDYWT